MHYPVYLKSVCRVFSAALLAVGLGATDSDAATFNVFDGATLLGKFQADPLGGQVTSAMFSVAGVNFDTIDVTDIPEYRPAFNDLTGPGSTIFANFYNSTAMGGCAALNCVLFFEKINPGPPDSYVYGGINLDTLENIAGGDYQISIAPIPLPASALLLLSGLAALRLRASRRETTSG